MTDCLLRPDWPAPAHVHACTTLRTAGVSEPPYDSWNLASHVQDRPQAVEQNRRLLQQRLALPAEPFWLEQVHGIGIVSLDEHHEINLQADGAFTARAGRVCCVMTADCLPVLITNRVGTEVAAVHAGWRGLANGVVEQALEKFTTTTDELLVWLGPAIGPAVFEVGEEVRQAFLTHDENAHQAFKRSPANTLLANLYQLARQRLELAGVRAVFGGDFCTYSDSERFFSYRRNAVTGRMASLIWIQS